MLHNYPDLLSIKDIQEILGIGQSKAYELAHSHTFPSIRVGALIRIPKAALIEWLHQQNH